MGESADAEPTSLPLRTALDWLFRNRATGHITIAQFPNVALWIVIGAAVVRKFLPADTSFRTVLDWIGNAALMWWAGDELLRGVNPWRRFLGILGCVMTVMSFVSLTQSL